MTQQMTIKKWLLPIFSIAILLLIIMYALGIIGGGSKIEPGNTPPKLSPVPSGAKTLTLKIHQSDNLISWPGTIRSRTVVKIAPKFNSRILDVNVEVGDAVKKGDVIAKLDEQAMQATYQEALAGLNAARAQAEQANADERRIKDLFNKEAATRQQYDAVIAQAKSARAAVKRAASSVKKVHVNLGENVLLAPFNGIISERLQEPGDMGFPNAPIVILQKSGNLRLEAAIPTHCAQHIKLGMHVGVRIDSLNKKLSGTISEIAPEIDQQTRTQLVKASMPSSEGLVHGLFAWLEQSCENSQPILMIPESSVLHYGQLEAVKIVDNNQVYTRHIRTGKQTGDKLEVLSGLHEGETILVNSGLAQ